MVSSPSKNTKTKTETGLIFLLHPRNTPHYQGWTSLQSKRMEKVFQPNGPKKQASIAAIFIHEKTKFKPKLNRKDRVGNYICSKQKIHQEGIAILNVSAPNTKN